MAKLQTMNYDPHKHPCYLCDKRHMGCHGECETYKEFENTKPKKPQNVYSPSGRMRDVFHKKGRIRNG